jgi:hypothetical protein
MFFILNMAQWMIPNTGNGEELLAPHPTLKLEDHISQLTTTS